MSNRQLLRRRSAYGIQRNVFLNRCSGSSPPSPAAVADFLRKPSSARLTSSAMLLLQLQNQHQIFRPLHNSTVAVLSVAHRGTPAVRVAHSAHKPAARPSRAPWCSTPRQSQDLGNASTDSCNVHCLKSHVQLQLTTTANQIAIITYSTNYVNSS
jgi:hypothetical protein